jgi:hypothetical protein
MSMIFYMCALAWILGIVLGCDNFTRNTQPFYDMSGLNYAPSVNPSQSGQAYMDVGRMIFTKGSQLDTTRAMGVRISKTFCVAPVVDPSVPDSQREYDFWAVGTDCCGSVQPQTGWLCGEISNPLANGGMRLMTDESRAHYRMAIQEAEATYGLKSKHPIFLTWMQDPTGEMASWRDNGLRMYLEGVFAFSVFSIFVALSAGIYFSRASMASHPCKGTGFHKYCSENSDDEAIQDYWDEAGYAKRVTL